MASLKGISLHVFKTNEAGRLFYEGAGFQDAERENASSGRKLGFLRMPRGCRTMLMVKEFVAS